jgi:hypothetical protein
MSSDLGDDLDRLLPIGLGVDSVVNAVACPRMIRASSAPNAFRRFVAALWRDW